MSSNLIIVRDYVVAMETSLAETHPWEVLWQVKGMDGAEYFGTLGSTITIANHNSEVFSNKLVRVNDMSVACTKPKPKVKLNSSSIVKVHLSDAGDIGGKVAHLHLHITHNLTIIDRVVC